SNTPPSENEKQASRTVAQTLNSQLHSMDAEIAYLFNILEEKKRKRAYIHDILRQHEAVLHPLRALQPEILSKIFLYCLPYSYWSPCWEDAPNRPKPSEAPLLLSQICRRWRTVALHTPQLWTV
ncbi:hypothetical protein CPB84DRAFT_1622766, partial [Gymnopilus junonius]